MEAENGRARPRNAEKGRERQRKAEKALPRKAEKGREMQRKAEKDRENQKLTKKTVFQFSRTTRWKVVCLDKFGRNSSLSSQPNQFS